MSKFKTKDLVKLGAAVAAAGAVPRPGHWLQSGQKRSAGENRRKKAAQALRLSNYRNTERGANARNSKGIYYSNGNYEAFARPEKPEGVDREVRMAGGQRTGFPGGGLLPGARRPDEGQNIHILEAMDIADGACDGINDPTRGYVMRGGREMENHFECLWDLFRSIPSLEVRMPPCWMSITGSTSTTPTTPVPCYCEPGRRCPHGWPVPSEPEGLHGNHEVVLYPGRRPL